jgi:putative tryptophan/tyrosine transport system substrate-binding protein
MHKSKLILTAFLLGLWIPFVAAQPGNVYRIGFLSTASAVSAAPRVQAFQMGLRELGYIDGRNIVIEYRWAEGRDDRLAGFAAELVRLKVNAIVTQGTVPTMAAKKASASVPIIMATAGDPVATGLVASLARPGGNITGLTQINPDVTGKRLEVLKEFFPGLARVVAVWNPGNPVSTPELRETETAARSLQLEVHAMPVKDPAGFQSAFSAMKADGRVAVILLSDIMFFGQRGNIAEHAIRNRLPVIAWTREMADSGVLVTYGPNTLDMHRRAATYVDKVLKGAKPAELPIEQPGKFELVLNLRTAKALGVQIPSSLLVRADRIIE